MLRGYRYRLYPKPEQAAALDQFCAAVRAVYNSAWAQRRDFWRQYQRATGGYITFQSQAAEVKDVRAAFDWMAGVPCEALHSALRELDRAYSAFFCGRAGFPRPRAKGVNEGFRLKAVNAQVRTVSARWSTIRIPKLGQVRFRSHRPLPSPPVAVAITKRGDAWWISITCEVAALPAAPAMETGIDRGVAQTLTLSSGEVLQAPDTSRLERLKRRAQRKLARRRKRSARYQEQRAKVRRISARVAAKRTDWCHRTSTDIAQRYGLVAIEALNIRGMTASAKGTAEEPGRNVRQKAGLNRAILDQSWSRFGDFLDYKLAARGGILITVPAAYTSQTCSHCGVVDSASRAAQSVFACVACDHTMNADHNAAINIWRRSTALLDVEAGVAQSSKRQPEAERPEPAQVGDAASVTRRAEFPKPLGRLPHHPSSDASGSPC